MSIIIYILIGVSVLSGFRIIIGPSVWDRLLGFSLMCNKIIVIIIIYSYMSRQSFYLDIGLIFAILGFVGTTSIATFLRKKSKGGKTCKF